MRIHEPQSVAHPSPIPGGLKGNQFTEDPTVMLELPREITILGGSIESLKMSILELRSRLQPVLRVYPEKAPTNEPNSGSSMEVTTEYGNRLRELWKAVDELEQVIRRMSNDLQL